MLVTTWRLAILLSRFLGLPDPEPLPSGSLSRAPFEWGQCEPGDGAAEAPMSTVLILGDGGNEPAQNVAGEFVDSRMGITLEDSFPAEVPLWGPSGPARPILQAEPPASQDTLMPHDSFGGFFRSHCSSDAWKEYVWSDYLTGPAVLLPLGLAVSAAAVYHWDHRLEQHWQGLLGGRQLLGNIGAYTLLGASILIGVTMPGEGRNSWDEFWTIAEAYVASTLTSTVTKYGVARLRPIHGTHSFPSGHTTIAFTGATLIELNSGELLGIPAYALAAFTGFERVEAGRHFPSDVLAGAAIGTLSAGLFDALHWGVGSGGEGIARRHPTCRVEMDGLRGGMLEFAFDF
jgi:membrane-associated phospholipid phosphatase